MQVPANLSSTDGTFENKIVVSWNATADATSYEVYRSPDGSGFIKIGDTTSTTYDDATSDVNLMSTSIRYIYKVRGKKTSGAVSSFSNSDAGYLKDFGKITDLSANIINGVIRLTWTNIPDVNKYRIYISENALEKYSMHATVSGSPYDVTDCQPEITYYFYVIPVKNGIDGYESNIASSMIPFASFRPNAPTASDASIAKINIKWESVNGASGYQLFRSDNISGPYSQIGIDQGNSALTYDDFAVTAGTYYYYRIRVLKSAQYSDYSYSDSGIATK
jgi:fibronectin type 3 domain-containing protein